MTIEEFKKLGYFIDTISTAYAHGKWDFEGECVVIEEYSDDIDVNIEYRILDKNHDIIESNFFDIEDVIDYIKNM